MNCSWRNYYESDPRSYEYNLTSPKNKPWKKIRPVRDLSPSPVRYRCSALQTELTSQLGTGRDVGLKWTLQVVNKWLQIYENHINVNCGWRNEYQSDPRSNEYLLTGGPFFGIGLRKKFMNGIGIRLCKPSGLWDWKKILVGIAGLKNPIGDPLEDHDYVLMFFRFPLPFSVVSCENSLCLTGAFKPVLLCHISLIWR